MKRYNLRLVEMDSGETVHEIEIKYIVVNDSEVFIDNPIHATFIELEDAIEEDMKDV
ncbi:hypothetical protein LCGC14_3165900 [marine sediment metagenome]|uniref:Uncharacterized protein n=1 Tax=marine sediment metagenome TaxID=412755 RepID=A0A0F8XT32_9ZZZZ